MSDLCDLISYRQTQLRLYKLSVFWMLYNLYKKRKHKLLFLYKLCNVYVFPVQQIININKICFYCRSTSLKPVH